MQNEQFAQRLKEARLKTGKTQEKIAREFHISRTCLSNYENGRRTPGVDTMHKLSKCLGVSVDFLLHGSTICSFSESLDISCLSEQSRKELINYYHYLKFKEAEDS